MKILKKQSYQLKRDKIIIGNKENKSDFKYTNIIAHLVENYSVSEDKIVFK